MQGWFKLYREIFDTDLWSDVTTFRLFVYLIGKASHQDGIRIKGVELKRGQYIRSYRKLADDLSYKEGRGYKKYSLSTIKKCVNKLIESERVNVKETEAGTLFTIINYAKYQGFNDTEKESENGIKEELQTNRELSANEPRTNCEQEQELKNYRIKELKRKEEETADPVINSLIKNNIVHPGGLTQTLRDDLNDITQTFGFDYPNQMIEEAIKDAARGNGRTWKFIYNKLNTWRKLGIKNPRELDFYNQKSNQKSFYQKQQSREVVPDWFKNRKNKQQKPVDPIQQQETEEEKEEFEALLREFTSKGVNG